jgi:hypothetical protein
VEIRRWMLIPAVVGVFALGGCGEDEAEGVEEYGVGVAEDAGAVPPSAATAPAAEGVAG